MTRADKVIGYLETLKCPDGSKVGQPLKLTTWQKRWIRKVYRRKNNRRVVRQAVLSIARKNGKTAIVAGLVLVHLCGPEAVTNGQLYSVSFEREQAGIVFKYLAAMVRLDEELSYRLKILESRKTAEDLENGSVYQALSSESRSKHGKSASFVVFDELAQFGADRELYDVMLTSSGAHEEPIFFVISTQAADHHAVLSELIDYGLANDDDETFTVDLYAVPMDLDPWDEGNWKLANPALGDFRSLDEMRDFAQKAKKMPSAENAFRNLYLNQRIHMEAAWISRQAWEDCAAEPVFGECRYGGLDLSAKNDLTALAWVEEHNGAIGAHLRAWTPSEGLPERAKRDKVPYHVWVKEGILLTTPGKVIDYRFVAAEIARLHAAKPFTAIAFDRWRIDDLKKALEEIGCGVELHAHGQGFKDMGPSIEAVEDWIVGDKLRHGGNPLYNMACSNAIAVKDPAGNRKFEKNKSLGRIDPIVALAMAAGCYREFAGSNAKSVYATRGLRTL